MPKRINNLFNKVCELDNIKLAIVKASEGKRDRSSVKFCLNNQDLIAKQIRELLITKTFKASPSNVRVIKDRGSHKERTIHIPKFYPDQIIHWSLMLVIEPILRRSQIENSFASIKGRGTFQAYKKIKKDLKRDPKNMKYYLKLDIEKCYPNIKKHIVLKTFERKFKDKDILWLVDSIIDDNNQGLPIGFYTSQWFANFVLSRLDKEVLKDPCVKHYYRYLDDIIIFGSNKRKLHKLLDHIREFTSDVLQLNIKHNYQLYNFYEQGLDFIGIRFFRNYCIMRKRNFKRVRRLVLRVERRGYMSTKQARQFASYYGWLEVTNNQQFFDSKIIKNAILYRSKETIRRSDKSK